MEKKKKNVRTSSEDEKPPKARSEEKIDRRGLWVVNTNRMKQYGDVAVERIGQVIRQQWLRNDDVLLKHNYVRPLEDHEEFELCEPCGRMFLGHNLGGPFRTHREFARHDLATLDLDSGAKAQEYRHHRVGDVRADPDSEHDGEWDLEQEGAPPPTKIEQEVGARSATVSL